MAATLGLALSRLAEDAPPAAGLVRLLAFLAPEPVPLNLLLTDEQAAGLLDPKVAAEVGRLWAGQAVPPLLSSFSADALRAAREADARWPRALLLEDLHAGWFDEAVGLGCVAVVTAHQCMDAAVIARLHAAGMRALVYTVNDASSAQRLLALGIDGLITDAVDRFSPAMPALTG